MKNLNQSIGSAVKWSGMTEVIAKLITPITSMVLARLLTPDAFGCVATVTMVISFADMFTDAGFQKYIIQREFASEEEKNQAINVAFWTNLALSALLSLLIVIFRNPIAKAVGSPELGTAIAVSCLTILLTAFSSIQMAVLKREMDFKTLFYARMAGVAIPLVVTIPLAFFTKSYWALILGTLGTHIANAVLLGIFSPWRPRLFYSFPVLKKMLSFSIWTLLETFTIWLTVNVDIFIIGTVLSAHHLGLYKNGMTTVNHLMNILTATITPIIYSALCRLQNDQKEFQNVFFRFQRVVSSLTIPMGVGIFLYRDFITSILLGSQWQEAADFIGIWAIASALAIHVNNYSSEVYRAMGKHKMSAVVQILHIVVLAPVMLVSVRYGFAVLVIARTLVRLQKWLVQQCFMKFFMHISPWKVIKSISPPILGSLVMAAAAYTLRWLTPGLQDNFFMNIAGVIMCAIVYAVFMSLAFPKLRRELISFVSGK